jgi:hypothetical protein
MATTTNFGWETPDDTDLVKDGAAAIRTSLNGVDTSFVDLKGGTTGQVLSKNSNTDLDYIWVTTDDANAIQNAIVDAKGDLIGATANDTPARLAVGTDGQVLTAASGQATGLQWQTPIVGGLTLLSTTTLSGNSVTISSISGAYVDLKIVFRNVTTSADSFFGISPNSSSANTYAQKTGGAASWSLVDGVIYAHNGVFNDGVNANTNMVMNISNYSDATAFKPFTFYGYVLDTTATNQGILGGGAYRSNTAISSINIQAGSTNTLGGTVLIYGVK